MPLSKAIGSYIDIERALTRARSAGGAMISFATPGKAINWRQRAYKYRAILLAQEAEKNLNVPGFLPKSKWDDALITIEGCDLYIRFGEPILDMKGLDGKPLKPKRQATPAPETDDLMAAAQALMQNLPEE